MMMTSVKKEREREECRPWAKLELEQRRQLRDLNNKVGKKKKKKGF